MSAPCCQEMAASLCRRMVFRWVPTLHGVWEGVGRGQTLISAGCMRKLCAWGSNAMESGHCQDSQAHGNWGMGPTQEALIGCPPA